VLAGGIAHDFNNLLKLDDSVRSAFERMLSHGVRELPVTDESARIIGFVDETSIAHAYMNARASIP
jgi:CBS-domain-containing membrane protein